MVSVIHVGNVARENVQQKEMGYLKQPTYNPDLSPCDFHIFEPLKKALNDKHSESGTKVQQAMKEFFGQQPQEFCQQGLLNLVKE